MYSDFFVSSLYCEEYCSLGLFFFLIRFYLFLRRGLIYLYFTILTSNLYHLFTSFFPLSPSYGSLFAVVVSLFVVLYCLLNV